MSVLPPEALATQWAVLRPLHPSINYLPRIAGQLAASPPGSRLLPAAGHGFVLHRGNVSAEVDQTLIFTSQPTEEVLSR